jgi:hypothetical protein
MGYCTHESRLVLRSAEIQPLIPRFVRFSLFDLNRLEFKSAPPQTQTTLKKHHTNLYYLTVAHNSITQTLPKSSVAKWNPNTTVSPTGNSSGAVVFFALFLWSGCNNK